MLEDRIVASERVADAYSFLSSIFLTLPNQQLLEGIAAMDLSECDSAGLCEIAAYVKNAETNSVEDTLLEMGRDRTWLVRGANNVHMEPPYESLYIGPDIKSNVSIGSLNRFYADSGFKVTNEVKDAPDQIGVEMEFVATLLRHEAAALRAGNQEEADQFSNTRDAFMDQHLGQWAHKYADAMYDQARSGFYRGIALLIKEIV